LESWQNIDSPPSRIDIQQQLSFYQQNSIQALYPIKTQGWSLWITTDTTIQLCSRIENQLATKQAQTWALLAMRTRKFLMPESLERNDQQSRERRATGAPKSSPHSPQKRWS